MGENPPTTARAEVTSLRDLSTQQWRSGAAAWLGWLFDGLDMHLYLLVAAPFVAELLGVDQKDAKVTQHSSWIQGAFMVGWALGGGFFGRVGDYLGRSRTLMLTILTYALFTSLSYFAQAWWHLLIFRFLAALGVGGEWAVGASLLSETWPRRWRPWMAAVLQSAVNVGVMGSGLALFLLADFPPRTIFLVGVVPALLVVWIRRAVPETAEWQQAKQSATQSQPGFLDLFRGPVRRTTILTLTVCALTLTGHWAFTYWNIQQLRYLPDVAGWTEQQKSQLVSKITLLLTSSSIIGNFLAAFVATWLRWRLTITLLCLAYCVAMLGTYTVPLGLSYPLWIGLATIGMCQGLFALFTMYLPPLFPTLLRTSGAGFCYNIGRIAAGVGIVVFGQFAIVSDFRLTLFCAAFLFLPAAAIARLLPEPPDEQPSPNVVAE